jgi:hypothetical protein
MSSESKHDIIDRLNRTGKFANQRDGAKNFARPLPVDAKLQGSEIAGLQRPSYDPKNPRMVVQSTSAIELRQFFNGIPTEQLYDVRELIDTILASRPDAKR